MQAGKTNDITMHSNVIAQGIEGLAITGFYNGMIG